MSKREITQVTMSLSNDKMREAWQRVMDHYGPEWAKSAILFDLVRIKSNEIGEKFTNRDRFNSIDARLNHLEDMIALLVSALVRQGAPEDKE
jgi:hypothetical protein